MSSSQRAGARRRPRRGLRVSQPAPVFFFFNDTPTTEIYTAQYTLSLHDALPIHRDGAVREPRAHPPDGPGTFMPRDRARHALDQRALLVLVEMSLLLGVRDAVPEDLVSALAQPLGDVRRHLVDGRVHLGLGGKAELVEQLEQAPDAHAVAVVAPAVDAVALRLVRRRDGGALAGAEAEGLDVERHVDGQATAPGPGIVGPLRD